MGVFKRIGKGLRKAFKKIGRGIKKAFGKFGKFMGKIGILGQLAMMFILPGIGGALLKGFGAMAGNMASLTGKFAGLSGSALGTVVKGVGTVLKGAHAFVRTGINAFKTVTNGITEFGKTALNKIPGINIEGASKNFFGSKGVFENITMDAKRIFDPFRSNITIGKGMSLNSLSSTTGLSESTLQQLNPGLDLNNMDVLRGYDLNLDFGNITPGLNEMTQKIATQANQMFTTTVSDPIDFTKPISQADLDGINYKINLEGTAANTRQFEYAIKGQEFPMGGQYPVDTVTTQTGQFYGDITVPEVDISGAIKAPPTVTGVSPATGETFSMVDPTYKPPSLFDLPDSKFQTRTVGWDTEFGIPSPIEGQFNTGLIDKSIRDAAEKIVPVPTVSTPSLLSPTSSATTQVWDSSKNKYVSTVQEGAQNFIGDFGEKLVEGGKQMGVDRLLYGKPEEYDYAPTGTGQVAGVLGYEQVQPASPTADSVSFALNQIGNPYGSNAFFQEALSILGMDMGGSSYMRRVG